MPCFADTVCCCCWSAALVFLSLSLSLSLCFDALFFSRLFFCQRPTTANSSNNSNNTNSSNNSNSSNSSNSSCRMTWQAPCCQCAKRQFWAACVTLRSHQQLLRTNCNSQLADDSHRCSSNSNRQTSSAACWCLLLLQPVAAAATAAAGLLMLFPTAGTAVAAVLSPIMARDMCPL